MNNIIGDEPCPKCREGGKDSSGNHLMLFSDGGGYCNRCGYTKAADGKEYEKEVELSKLTVPDIKKYNYSDITERGISASTCKKYGVRTSVDTSTGEVDSHYYPISLGGKLVAYKQRVVDGKKFFSIGESLKGEKPELFGQVAMGGSGKKLLITGGELDAMCAYQMMQGSKYAKNIKAVSLPAGENVKGVADNLKWVMQFEEVLVYMDMDAAGRKAAGAIAELIGNKAKVMATSAKDACDMFKAGKQEEFISAIFNAQGYKPEGFVTVDDVYEAATKMPTWGRSWPWPSLTKLTYGRRDGEGTYFGAGVKMGKSEAVNEIVHHITQVEGGKVAIFKLEEDPAMTVRKLAGKICGKAFHKPDGDFTQAELKKGVDKVRDSGIVMFNSYGFTEWDKLKSAIRHAVLVDGCKDIIIDPLTRLTSGMTASDANTQLEQVADEISKLAKDIGFHYMFFCHLKAPTNGKPHEEGGKVHSNQFTGSRAMMRAAYYFIGIQRDKSPDLEDEVRNMSTFVLLEDRAFGNSGQFLVNYNKETGDYLEPTPDEREIYEQLMGE